VLTHVIRPCIGRGRGRHLYRPDMLREHAEHFAGWPMYVDHLSPQAKQAQAGLPRSLTHVGGIVEESWWDADVPADPRKGFGKGAVVGWARPFGLAKKLIDFDPRLVEASISADATGVRETTVQEAAKALGLQLQEARHARDRVYDVVGIAEGGSVDWVTLAGAGGRVVTLMESLYDEGSVEAQALITEMNDDEFVRFLDTERPYLREALADDNQGGDMGEVTPEAIQEALQSEAGQSILQDVIQEAVQAQVNEQLPALVEAERDVIRAEAEASADRKVQLRDMRDEAAALIAEAKLPPTWKEGLRQRFSLRESGQPSSELDVVEEVDDKGQVTKGASSVLREAVEAAIKDERRKLGEAVPTRVHGQGPGQVAPGDKQAIQEGENKGETRHQGTLYGSVLQEAGVDMTSDPWARV